MTDTRTLLAEYVQQGSDSAFRELVSRYLDLVYATALRLVDGDTHSAQDVTQTVFIHLARKAPALSGELFLGGWLHRDTCNVAANHRRSEQRRRTRERQALELTTMEDHTQANLAQLAPILDDAINQLGREDRTAILLRFFEQRDLCAVGMALGSSEDAARMRVNRALDKLHALLQKRGLTCSATAFATLLTAKAASAAPVGLAANVAGTALASAAAGGGITATVWKTMMLLTKPKLAVLSGLAIAGLVAPLVVQHSSITRLRQEVSALRLQLAAAEQARANTTALPAGTLPEEQLRELLRLRGKAGLFRSQTEELAQLQQENRRLCALMAAASSAGGGPTNPFAARSFVPLTQLAFAGYATPEAALESLLWAERETNLTAYITSLLPDQQPAELARLQRQSEQGGKELFFQEPGAVSGFQFLDSKPVSDDEVALTFFVGGRDGVMKVVAKQMDNEWKFYGGPTF